ncbi:hypothetical protein B0H10DRAFT_1131446 [Mycena sp. CBHHK59/15]|nr:hypothetical protein B0H10DRAFT_1131446 [Mycena sp. CBHHK59/15]
MALSRRVFGFVVSLHCTKTGASAGGSDEFAIFRGRDKNKSRYISKRNRTQKDIIHAQERCMVASGASRELLFHFESPNCRVALPNYGGRRSRNRQENASQSRIIVVSKGRPYELFLMSPSEVISRHPCRISTLDACRLLPQTSGDLAGLLEI